MDRIVRKDLLRDASGTSAVEFSIVFPVFVLVLLGIMHYAMYFGAVHSASQLAADAARASVAGLSDDERARLAERHVQAGASGYAMLDRDRVAVSAFPLADDPTQFRVTVRYDADNLPIWNLASFLPLPARVIERSATIKRGGY